MQERWEQILWLSIRFLLSTKYFRLEASTNTGNEGAKVMEANRLLQVLRAATEKALSPMVNRHVDDEVHCWWRAQLSCPYSSNAQVWKLNRYLFETLRQCFTHNFREVLITLHEFYQHFSRNVLKHYLAWGHSALFQVQ
jgi:hypothetical protein